MAIPIKSQAHPLRDIEERLEALEQKRPYIPLEELRAFEEFVADLRDTIEILRRDVRQQPEAVQFRGGQRVGHTSAR